MDKSLIIILSISLVLLILLAVHHYIFSIYELTYQQNTTKLFADEQSILIIEAIPVNALGKKAPFRNANTKFEIREGSDLVDVLINDYESGIIKIRAKSRTGKVVIHSKSQFSLLPTSFEILIEPNLALVTNLKSSLVE
ncbi:MAG: hypothetical protein Q8N03_09945 [Ignavibacteria bacterium]|jgi:hypothetical protein|nr:hypothetical protein [Ignavibacteria bacterium]MDP3831277.1 hypothetical protein [Ignavibacteriaceae bacterium]